MAPKVKSTPDAAMQKLWTVKYADHLVGIDKQLSEMREWLEALKLGDAAAKNILVLAGPTGSGKTAAAYLLLREAGYRVMERHGADHRTKTAFENDILQTVRCSWNGMIKQAVLVEDIDSITVTTNNCGLDVLTRIANGVGQKDAIPVICTMEEANSKGKLNDLVKRCQVVVFERLGAGELMELSEHISEAEGFALDVNYVHKLVKAAAGDARWLVNALELEYGARLARGGEIACAADRKLLDEREAVRRLLYGTREPHETGHLGRLEGLCQGQEAYAISSLVQENYAIACGEDIHTADSPACIASDVDLVDNYIHRTQDWPFLEHIVDMGALSMAWKLATSREEPRKATSIATRKRTHSQARAADTGVQLMKRRRNKRGAVRSAEEGSVNLCSAWSKVSYASARAKKLADLRSTIRGSCAEMSNFDLEWLFFFSSILRASLEDAATEAEKIDLLTQAARGYNMGAKCLDDCLKMSGGAGLTRTVLSRLASSLSCYLGRPPGEP
jgi:hypothetical protein